MQVWGLKWPFEDDNSSGNVTPLGDTIHLNFQEYQRIDPMRKESNVYAYIKQLPSQDWLSVVKTGDTWEPN